MFEGGSNVHSIPGIIDELARINPKTILDIGAGYGKYGVLCNEYLKELKAIDALEPNTKRLQFPQIYRNVFNVKIQDFKNSENTYDVALMTAMIGNLKKDEGHVVIEELRKYCRWIVISFEKEKHGLQQQWKPYDFAKYTKKDTFSLPFEWLVILNPY